MLLHKFACFWAIRRGDRMLRVSPHVSGRCPSFRSFFVSQAGVGTEFSNLSSREDTVTNGRQREEQQIKQNALSEIKFDNVGKERRPFPWRIYLGLSGVLVGVTLGYIRNHWRKMNIQLIFGSRPSEMAYPALFDRFYEHVSIWPKFDDGIIFQDGYAFGKLTVDENVQRISALAPGNAYHVNWIVSGAKGDAALINDPKAFIQREQVPVLEHPFIAASRLRTPWWQFWASTVQNEQMKLTENSANVNARELSKVLRKTQVFLLGTTNEMGIAGKDGIRIPVPVSRSSLDVAATIRVVQPDVIVVDGPIFFPPGEGIVTDGRWPWEFSMPSFKRRLKLFFSSGILFGHDIDRKEIYGSEYSLDVDAQTGCASGAELFTASVAASHTKGAFLVSVKEEGEGVDENRNENAKNEGGEDASGFPSKPSNAVELTRRLSNFVQQHALAKACAAKKANVPLSAEGLRVLFVGPAEHIPGIVENWGLV